MNKYMRRNAMYLIIIIIVAFSISFNLSSSLVIAKAHQRSFLETFTTLNLQTVTHSKVKSNKFKINPKSNGCYLIVFGGVSILLGFSLILLQATIMSFISENLLDLTSDTYIYKLWQKYPGVPMSITLFNWTNHKDFFNRSVKPKFEEVGPYTYTLQQERVDVVRNDNNNTITFKELRTFNYDTNFSNNGNLSDRLITINYVVMAAAHMIKDWDDTIKDIFTEYMSIVTPHYYFDTIIESEILKGSNNLILELLHYLEFILPDVPRVGDFAWLKVLSGNPNFEGVYNVQNGINRQFEVLNWNYRSTTPYFNDSCGEIKGSLGDIYSFPLNKEFITVFSRYACRSLKLYFEKEVIIDGILGYKYSITKLSLDNGTLNPENRCSCSGPCVPSGLLRISSCLYNLNADFSLPHFFNADPVYLDPIEGLNPEKQKHEAYIVIEPNSLICLESKLSLQLNLFLYPVEGVSLVDDFPKLTFPMVWVDSLMQLPDDLKMYLNIYLYIPSIIIVTAIILMTLGISGTFYGLYKFRQLHSFERSQIIKYGVIKT